MGRHAVGIERKGGANHTGKDRQVSEGVLCADWIGDKQNGGGEAIFGIFRESRGEKQEECGIGAIQGQRDKKEKKEKWK